MHPIKSTAWVSLALANVAFAHVAMFHKAMYCFNGTDPNGNPNNNNAPVQPLWDLPYVQYWMHHDNKCDEFPPEPGVFLELQAGSTFTAELAVNRAFTTWNTDPNAVIGTGLDGQNYTSDFGFSNGNCITEPNIHTHNYTTAAGTAIAIAYKSDITQVGIKDLVVITVAPNSPFFRVVEYPIPSGLPECPDGGCICTSPGTCGEPNIYMMPYKCKVIPDSTTPKTLGSPKPPVWCGEDPSQCVKGPKQIIIWNQAEGDNIEVSGWDQYGQNKAAAYNPTCGFSPGAQNDIFVESGNEELALSPSLTPSSSTTPSSSPIPSSSPNPSSSPVPTTPILDSSPSPSSVPPSYSWSSIPSGSGWPGPSGDPTPCQEPQPSSSGNPDPATQRSKRMLHHRRETRNVF